MATEIKFEIIAGKRRSSKLLYTLTDKQLYAKRSSKNNKTYYTCYVEKCTARVVVEDNVCVKCSKTDHNHPNQEDFYKELTALRSIKIACLESANIIGEVSALSGIRNIFENISSSNQNATSNLNFNQMRRGLQYIANKNFVASPAEAVLEAFQTESIYKKFGVSLHENNEETPFFKTCHIDDEFAYCIFASDKIVKLIRENLACSSRRTILIDGTFACVPFGCFKQFVVVHIEYFQKVFPFVFVLMTNKTLKCYRHVLNYINTNVINLDGSIFMSDYETGLRRTISAEFPSSKLLGCWFHYCQAVRRHVTMKHKDLAETIRRSSQASIEYHKLLSLPLLPAAHIVSSFNKIKEAIASFDHQERFNQFLSYFEKQWLQKVGPYGISVFGAATRTTSAVEVYNGVLGNILPKHGNFFKFVKVLQNEEFNKSKQFETLANSDGAIGNIKRKKKSIEASEKIENAWKQLREGNITASAFLDKMVYKKNSICVQQEPEDDLFADINYLEDEEGEEEFDSGEVNAPQEFENNLCVVCTEVEPNIVLLPCKHLKVCATCNLKLQADCISKGLSKYACPICRQEVDDSMQVFL